MTEQEAANEAGEAPREPEETGAQETRVEQQVELQRSVRYGRILIVFGLIGAVLSAMVTLMFPVGPEADYTMAQIVGFMIVVGAVVGLGVGAILSIVLTRVAKRHTGTGVAIQTDVR